MSTRQPVYIQGESGALFAYHRHAQARLGSVLLVQPFAEEMNKSRRMFSLLGEALLDQGVSSLLLDFYGTGDSAGDFGDARWESWREDLSTGADYLARQGDPLTAVVALRAGALLAADWYSSVYGVGQASPQIVFWQPLLSGATWLTQFLRQRSVATKFAGGNEPVKELKARLVGRESMEVAGYTLSPLWAAALDRQVLTNYRPPEQASVAVIEVGRLDDAEGPAGRAVRTDWSHLQVDTAVIPGDAFWISQEIVEVPELIRASVAFLTKSSV